MVLSQITNCLPVGPCGSRAIQDTQIGESRREMVQGVVVRLQVHLVDAEVVATTDHEAKSVQETARGGAESSKL